MPLAPERERVLTPEEIRRKIREIAEEEGIYLCDLDVEEILAEIGDGSNFEGVIRAICKKKRNQLFRCDMGD